MKLVRVLLVAALSFASAGFAADQPETFVVPEPGSDDVDGKKLSQQMDRADPRAANNIGWLYARGEGGVKQDFKEAQQWWKFAASRGFTPSINNLGLLYAQGHGVKQNYEEAFKWWMRAAERGDAWAMNAVGDLYENGQGVNQSYELALAWYREAAREGDPLGMWNMGHLTEKGLGVAADPAEALGWYRQAAEKGYAPAMHSLGTLYAQGRGVQADVVEAYAHMALAARRFGPEEAEEARQNEAARDALSRQLDDGQRAAAETLANALGERYRKPEKAKAAPGSST